MQWQSTDFRGALRWLADHYGLALNDRPLSPREKAEWANYQRALERDMPFAYRWKRLFLVLGDESLDAIKAGFFDGQGSPVDCTTLWQITALLTYVTRLEGARLVQEYRWWYGMYPEFTRALLQVAATREIVEHAALAEFLGISNAENPGHE